MKPRASRIFLTLAVVLVLFALSQTLLDVALAVLFSQMVQSIVVSGSSAGITLSMEQNWVRIYTAREALIAINKHCDHRWTPSLPMPPYGPLLLMLEVTAIPSLLILSTLVTGLYATFAINTASTPILYSLALVTNFVLLGLTAGRIWRKGRQATVGVEAGHRYNKTLEIICESSLLYFLIYFIASVTQPTAAALPNLAWGSLAQVVNIVPIIIIVRVGIARNSGEQETDDRIFHGGNAGREDKMNPTAKEKISEQVIEDSTDEIFEVAQKMCDDRENMETNAGDDGAASAQDPKPTRKDALQALSILRRYLQDEHGTYACKPKLGLAMFGRETQLECSKHMIPTTITDYFGV
ncbi:hypothetical protein B0H13DRAFT_2362034 [Mycena leptocephala]|nr:hypothetical protein B0H13DRAFT_2362034 [Mycena leptocephala]